MLACCILPSLTGGVPPLLCAINLWLRLEKTRRLSSPCSAAQAPCEILHLCQLLLHCLCSFTAVLHGW